MAWQARMGPPRRGWAWIGGAGVAGIGTARSGAVGPGMAGEDGPGLDRRGADWHGRLGMALISQAVGGEIEATRPGCVTTRTIGG